MFLPSHALPEGYDLEDNGIEEEDSTPIEELIDEEVCYTIVGVCAYLHAYLSLCKFDM